MIDLEENNTSKYPGVYFDKAKGKFKARIEINGKREYLGSFETPEEASIAYIKAFFGKTLNNPSKYPGVCFDKAKGKYRARIVINGRKRSLGHFERPEEAFIAFKEAKLEVFRSFFPSRTRDDFIDLLERAEAPEGGGIISEEGEVWKVIPGYPEYEISNFGRVKSFKRRKPHIMKLNKDIVGYLSVQLSNNSKPKCCRIYDLLARAFVGVLKKEEIVDIVKRRSKESGYAMEPPSQYWAFPEAED